MLEIKRKLSCTSHSCYSKLKICFSYSKFKETYGISTFDEIHHKNGIVSSTPNKADQQHNGVLHDKQGETVDQPSSTTVGNDHEEIGSKSLEFNGEVYSIVSEENGEEVQELQEELDSAKRDVEMNGDGIITYGSDELLGVDDVDYVQEEFYRATEQTQSTQQDDDDSNNNDKVDSGVSSKEKQKEMEVVNGEQDDGQLESTQQNQQSSSSSSSYNPSPVKDTRVSVHRELDADYKRTTDSGNVRTW